METLRLRNPLTPVLCEGVKKDPRPSRGESVEPRGCEVDPEDGARGRDEEVEDGEFIIKE